MSETFFIADIHLDERQPKIIEAFQNFLTRRVTNSAGLYILGDLFEFWLGDDDNNPVYLEIQHSLKQLTSKGIPIYFIQGNRDFLIGEQFAQNTGCQILNDETVIELNGTRVLLMHGDTLCTDDLAYQKLRKVIHSKIIQTIYLTMPLSVRRYISQKGRQQSSHFKQHKSFEIMDVSQHAVEETMQKHQVNYLIHGHIHRPNYYKFQLNQCVAQRLVVDAWYQRGNAAIFDGQHFRLEAFV